MKSRFHDAMCLVPLGAIWSELVQPPVQPGTPLHEGRVGVLLSGHDRPLAGEVPRRILAERCVVRLSSG